MLQNNKMKVSVCITIFNEKEETVRRLLAALDSQTLKADEIIIIDASKKTQRFKKSKTPSKLKFEMINKENVSRAMGRNIAIGKAKNEIIAITDAGCIPHKDWLEKITKPFKIATPSARNDTVNDTVVAGAYQMIAKNNFEKAESIFLGVSIQDMDDNFIAKLNLMPSARSMAFTKTIWKKAGGFPENLKDTAEDTVFNLNLIKVGAKFIVAKDAIVDWQMPSSIKSFYLKIKNYARGDARSGIWWHPIKKLKTHNLKLLTIFARYLLAFVLLEIGQYGILWGYIGIYMLWAFKKAGFWGILLQFVSDFAVMLGFLFGVFESKSTSG